MRHEPLKEKLTGLDAGEQLGAAWSKLDVATTTSNNSYQGWISLLMITIATPGASVIYVNHKIPPRPKPC